MSEEVKTERKVYCEKLSEENNQSWSELSEHVPGFRLNVEQAQVGLLVQALVDTEVWTDAQATEYEIVFQEAVKALLDETWEKVRNMRAKKNLIRQPTKKRIILPGE